jgi:hypothetical protein
MKMDLELPKFKNFQWGIHFYDEWYTEIRQGSIIYREFTDDCIMKYRVDREGKPQTKSFKWVIKTHYD